MTQTSLRKTRKPAPSRRGRRLVAYAERSEEQGLPFRVSTARDPRPALETYRTVDPAHLPGPTALTTPLLRGAPPRAPRSAPLLGFLAHNNPRHATFQPPPMNKQLNQNCVSITHQIRATQNP
ncbi:uncharacterized protein [Penaeus vannamei]|uniref:uncharacterized protein n=1 Tax=Penaeus vannamei TaxID=6689 RepID=UPI00387F6F3B